jgi:hypothetical protein
LASDWRAVDGFVRVRTRRFGHVGGAGDPPQLPLGPQAAAAGYL